MKAMLRVVQDVTKEGGERISYECLMFCCPGCAEDGSSGLHMLPISPREGKEHWSFDGNLERPTLSPSILTKMEEGFICHSYLEAGMFRFLDDCTHSLKGKIVSMPDLPVWVSEHGS